MRNSKFILLALVPLLTHCVSSKNRMAPMAYQYELNESDQLIKAGHPAQALEELEMLIQMDPENEAALYLHGLANQKLNRFDAAAADYESVVKKNPKNSKAHYNAAMIYAYQLNEKGSSIRHFDQFLSIEPFHAQSFNVAKIMVNLDRAKADGLAQSPDLEQKIQSAEAISNTDERRKYLLECVKSSPDSAIFYFLVGQTYESGTDRSDAVKAAEYYRMSLSRKPTCAPCQQRLGKLLVKLGKPEDAKMHFRKAELFSPNGMK